MVNSNKQTIQYKQKRFLAIKYTNKKVFATVGPAITRAYLPPVSLLREAVDELPNLTLSSIIHSLPLGWDIPLREL